MVGVFVYCPANVASFFPLSLHMKNPMLSLHMRTTIIITANKLHLRKSKLIRNFLLSASAQYCVDIFSDSLLRDTEYYDYGHGEAQEATYEPYGTSF